LPAYRWLTLIVLLAAEVLLLTLRFDANALVQDREQWWARLVLQARYLPQLGSGIIIAILIFGGASWAEEIRRLARQSSRLISPWPFVIAHLLTYAGFVKLTEIVLEGDIRSSPHPGAWVLGWALLGFTTLLFWIGAVLPPRVWLHLVARAYGTWIIALLLSFAAVEAGRFTASYWELLGRSTLWLVHGLLGLFGQAFWDPGLFRVGTSRFWVEIAPQCSGYEGIGLIWVFLSFYLWFHRHEIRFPQALLLLPLGTIVMWLANAIRITALIGVGHWLDPQIAMAGFHSQAGWLAFNVVALGLLVAARSSRFFARVDPHAETTSTAHPNAAAYLAPLFATLAAMMITEAFSTGGFPRLYPIRVLAAGLVLWLFRREYAALSWRCSWFAFAAGTAAFCVWAGLEFTPLGVIRLTGSLYEWSGLPPGWAETWVVFRVLGSVVTVPLAEELAFRGYLTRRLQARDFCLVPAGRFTWFSFLVSSILFGALHSRWLAGTLVGMVYALALYRRGRVADAVWAHAITNAFIAIFVIVTGHWLFWQ
jgi:exosortase E/protease (VPEID-CTERM system)